MVGYVRKLLNKVIRNIVGGKELNTTTVLSIKSFLVYLFVYCNDGTFTQSLLRYNCANIYNNC